jgi:hypothetical protein
MIFPRVRLVMVGLIVALFTAGSVAEATGHSSGHTSGKSSSKAAGRSKKKKGDDQPAHVKGYTKNEGTVVSPHDRKRRKSGTSSAATVPHASAASRRSNRCEACDRDEHGKLLRSGKAKQAFERSTGYPHGRTGYVIDHIRPLACGGRDLPSNMQWQTKADAKTKDKTERASCR